MKVGIIGFGITQMTSPKPDQTPAFHELPFLAVKRALEDAGVERGKVDFFVEASYDFLDGRMISNMYTCTTVGGYLEPESRISDDGLLALAYASAKILSGDAEVVVVAGHGVREVDHAAVSRFIYDPFIYRPLGMNYIVSLALASKSYIVKYRVKEDAAIHVVTKNRYAGHLNPNGHLKEKVSREDVYESSYVAYPLRQLMLPPQTVGSVALILASEPLAKRLCDSPIWVDSIAWCTDSYNIGDKPLHIIQPLQVAAKKAYSKAGISDPAKDIDLFEVCDVTPYHELMAYEALGLAPLGQGWRLVMEGTTDPFKGAIPVNVSGGSLSTDPYPASSLFRIVEACLQLRGKAYARQIDGIERVLVHGFSYISGASAQTHIVAILGV